MALRLKDLLPGLFGKTIDLGGGLLVDNSGNVTVPGNLTISGTTFTDNEATTITSNSANALAVGANGVTNPVFNVDGSVSSVATGVTIQGAAAGTSPTLQTISSGTNEGLIIKSKGTGSLALRPGSDTLHAVTFQSANGSSTYMNIDTTNGFVGVNKFTPAQPLDVGGNIAGSGSILTSGAAGGVGYATGAGGAITQTGSRTTTVVVNTPTGAITLVSAAGSTAPATFTVTNSQVAATDVIILNQKSGTDKYELFVTAVGAGSFNITFFTTGGTTTEQPVFNFAVIKGVAA